MTKKNAIAKQAKATDFSKVVTELKNGKGIKDALKAAKETPKAARERAAFKHALKEVDEAIVEAETKAKAFKAAKATDFQWKPRRFTTETPKEVVVKPIAEVLKAAKAAPKAAPAKAAAPGDTLAIHINKTGRVCFGKLAAARIGSRTSVMLTIDAKGTVRMDALDKYREGALPVRDANGRPYISATKQLKTLGFDGSRPYDIEAKPINGAGFEFKLA